MSKFRGYALGVAASASFGLIPLFSLPLIGSGLNTPSILTFRFGLAAVAVALLMSIRKIPFKLSRQQTIVLVTLGVCNFFSALLLFYGYSIMPSGAATVTHFVYPVFVALIMFFFFRQKLPFTTMAAIFMAIVGVALLAGLAEGSSTTEGPSLLGITIVALSGLAYALYIVVVNKCRMGAIHFLTITFYVTLIDGLLFGIYALCMGDITPPVEFKQWGLIFLLALIPTVISNITLVLAIDMLGSTPTAILGAMEPLTAVIVGMLVFGESLTSSQAIGVGLVIIAVLLIVQGGRPLRRKQETSSIEQQ